MTGLADPVYVEAFLQARCDAAAPTHPPTHPPRPLTRPPSHPQRTKQPKQQYDPSWKSPQLTLQALGIHSPSLKSSKGSLPFACDLRHLLQMRGWKVTGDFLPFLPDSFKERVSWNILDESQIIHFSLPARIWMPLDEEGGREWVHSYYCVFFIYPHRAGISSNSGCA